MSSYLTNYRKMYHTFGISLSSQTLPIRNKKLLELRITLLRIINELKYSINYAPQPKQYLTRSENVFIERGDRFKILHNTQVWIGINNLGPLINIENINEVIKKQTEIQKKNLRKIQEIKETKINDVHIPKYVRIKQNVNKYCKPKKFKNNKLSNRSKPENDLRLQQKKEKELMGEYYWPEKIYNINLLEDITELRQKFRKKGKKTKPLTIAKILHPRGQQQPNIKVKQNTQRISDIFTIDRDMQNNVLNKIFNGSNNEQLKTSRYIDNFKKSPLLFTNKGISLNKPGIKLYYTLDSLTFTQSTAKKIKAMINSYGTDSLRRLRIFNGNHYTYIYDKHLFDDIVEQPPKVAHISPKRPQKRLQILDVNALKKDRIFQYIKKDRNYLKITKKSIHMQMNLPIISGNKIVIRSERMVDDRLSNEWFLLTVLAGVKLFFSKILLSTQKYFDKWLRKNHKLVDRIRSYLGLRRSKYIDLFPKLTNSDMTILQRKQKHNQTTSVCHLDNVHPTRIINTRNDYFIQPSKDDLIPFLDTTNQTCIVDNFTIGRLSYGKIEFMEPVDVYNLNIDKYVEFTRKNIDIYANNAEKPPIGVGLNKKAKITLYEVWPNDKYTNGTITDVRQLESLHFKSMLEAISTERNFKFVSYCGSTGCWVFHVDHF